MKNEVIPIQTVNGIAVVDSRDMADRLNVEHEALIRTISKYLVEIQAQFGLIEFSVLKTENPYGGRPKRFTLLTEEQCYYVATLSRNTRQVLDFKALLVRSFTDFRHQRNAPVTLDARAGAWLDLRDLPYDKVELDGSMVRRVVHEEREYFSLNDVTTAIGTRTKSGQVADKLNVKQPLALRIMLFGMTHPGWFATR